MLFELALLVTILGSPADVRPDAPAPSLQLHVVVHRSNPVTTLTEAQVSAIFMRRTRNWPDGSAILPIDQLPGAPVRQRFSRSVHKKSVAYVIRYWQRLIFAGRAVPPPQAKSDAAVIELVKKNPAAIGYLDHRTAADDVQVVTVTP